MDYQAKMTMVDSFGGMSRPIQSHLVNVNRNCPSPKSFLLSAHTKLQAEARVQKHTWDYVHHSMCSNLDIV